MPGTLSINLAAIKANWQTFRAQLAPTCECAAVVKANAYGLGVQPVATTLSQAGCDTFFVANLAEAQELRSFLTAEKRIFILSGVRQGEEAECIESGFIPVLVSLPHIEAWAQACRQLGAQAFSALKVDTGMHRLGLTQDEFSQLLSQPELILSCSPVLLMSHLACANDSTHPLNNEQLQVFTACVDAIRKVVPTIKTSLANSGGVFLGGDFHGDLVRPGIGLYGGNPTDKNTNPMQSVATLTLPILQIKTVAGPASVGYGATYTVAQGEKKTLAIAEGGYADGFLRSLSNNGFGLFAGQQVPVVGRVSMDSIIFDISDIDETLIQKHPAEIVVVHPDHDIDALATEANTIGYEILTSLGQRYRRVYESIENS